jgi:hypothetical protein
MDLEQMKSLLSDIYERKMMKQDGKKKFHDKEKIMNDERYNETKTIIDYYYYDKGFGIKYFIKYFELNITPSVFRLNLIKIFDIKLRKHNDITDNLRKLRSEKAIYENTNNIGAFSDEVQKKLKIKNKTIRGAQGYYFNESLKKYVWLRSSWEYIYAKWLDKNNIIWDIEKKVFHVGDKKYRPDFFIYDENKKISKIVEVKGFWKDKVWKFRVLMKQMEKQKIDFILIENIKPYCETTYKKELKNWKDIRLSKKKITKNEINKQKRYKKNHYKK